MGEGGARYEGTIWSPSGACVYIATGCRTADEAIRGAHLYAEQYAAAELRRRTGIPTGDVGVYADPISDAIETARISLACSQRVQRDRVCAAVYDFLRRREEDWERRDGVGSAAEAKAIADAEMVELFSVIGGAL
jgi:hypothetical protein